MGFSATRPSTFSDSRPMTAVVGLGLDVGVEGLPVVEAPEGGVGILQARRWPAW